MTNKEILRQELAQRLQEIESQIEATIPSWKRQYTSCLHTKQIENNEVENEKTTRNATTFGLMLLLTSNAGEEIEQFLDIIENGADINYRVQSQKDITEFGEGNTPLILACKNKHSEYAKLLIEAGADVNAINSRGETALKFACTFGMTDVALALINAKADPNTLDEQGYTPLAWACKQKGVRYGNLEVINALIEIANADINLGKNYIYRTPLMVAVETNLKRTNIVQYLLDKGANATIQRSDGKTAFDIAKEKGYEEMAELIRLHIEEYKINKQIFQTDNSESYSI